MKHKEGIYLFYCNFVCFFVGFGLLPLLPLYAAQYGATPTAAGLYLGVVYLAISAGTILTGWLAGRLGAKTLFVAAGVVGAPALLLHGYTTALWQLVPLTAIVWFCGGVGTAMVNVFTGMTADHKRRGRSFGLMYLAFPAAAMIGGVTVGQLVELQGFAVMFTVLAVMWVVWPAAGLFLLDEKTISLKSSAQAGQSHIPFRLYRGFYTLLLAALIAAMAAYVGRLGISLSMQALHFSAGAISSTTTVAGLVTVPVTFLIGSLSDRLGRRGFLVQAYLLVAAGLLALGFASQLWHFWLAMGLMLMGNSINGSLAAALATDLLDPQALSRGLPWLSSMSWIAGIAGFAMTGYLFETLGATPLYFLAASVAVGAAGMLGLLRGKRRAVIPAPAASR